MNQRSVLIIAILALSTGMGAFEAYLVRHHFDLRVATAASLFPFAILLFTWCKADASYRRVAPPPVAALLVGLFALIGIPYYFFRVLPPARAVINIIWALAIFALSMLLTAAAYTVALRAYEMV